VKVVVIGGTGLIGSKLVAKLCEHGHEAVPAAPNTGVNTLTGEGLAEALDGAAVVVDVSNSPSFADDAVIQDPVGPSAWDPTGEGLKGKQAIADFYDMFSQFQQTLAFDIHHLTIGNNEVAVFVTLHSTLMDGTVNSIKAISIYATAQDGRIQSLRSFQAVP
jgi:NAD(P)-dependent dehydrogenase (short-subunit alcohol dehydrogenase family)